MDGVCNSSNSSSEEDDGRPVLHPVKFMHHPCFRNRIYTFLLGGWLLGPLFFKSHQALWCYQFFYCSQSDSESKFHSFLPITHKCVCVFEIAMTFCWRENICFFLQNWSPVLNKYGVALPLECPLNLSRDMLAARESIKKTRSSYWQCVRCGKKFYLERHLDLHIERRHPDVINHVSSYTKLRIKNFLELENLLSANPICKRNLAFRLKTLCA